MQFHEKHRAPEQERSPACIAIDRDIADVGQKSCASVGNGIRFLQQPWVSVDVVDVAETFLEIAGTEHILQEVNICLDA